MHFKAIQYNIMHSVVCPYLFMFSYSLKYYFFITKTHDFKLNLIFGNPTSRRNGIRVS